MAYRDRDGAVIDRAAGDDWAAPLRSRRSSRHCPRRFRAAVRRPVADASALPGNRLRPPPAAAGVLALAELRAAEIGVGADRVLIAAGAIDEETYVAALARSLGMVFEPLETSPRASCPLARRPDCIEAANTGMLPLTVDGEIKIVVAPRAARQPPPGRARRQSADMATRIRLTTTARLQRLRRPPWRSTRSRDRAVRRRCGRASRAVGRHAAARPHGRRWLPSRSRVASGALARARRLRWRDRGRARL